tara:strand:+ start:327 stop:818 length:492 start_codon:yes stop_codon:yes gene_type:complete
MKFHKTNFKSIGDLVEPLIKRHGQLKIISYAKLLDIWDTIVGEEISKKAHPIKMRTIKSGKKNMLYLGMTGPYMAELSLQLRDIIEKINSFYSKEVIVQIKLKRLYDIKSKNVVELDNSHDFSGTKSIETNDSKFAVIQLENALTKMKNNLSNSRKKNEIMED